MWKDCSYCTEYASSAGLARSFCGYLPGEAKSEQSVSDQMEQETCDSTNRVERDGVGDACTRDHAMIITGIKMRTSARVQLVRRILGLEFAVENDVRGQVEVVLVDVVGVSVGAVQRIVGRFLVRVTDGHFVVRCHLVECVHRFRDVVRAWEQIGLISLVADSARCRMQSHLGGRKLARQPANQTSVRIDFVMRSRGQFSHNKGEKGVVR